MMVTSAIFRNIVRQTSEDSDKGGDNTCEYFSCLY